MKHSAFQRLTALTMFTALAHCTLACGADTDRNPPIGAPPGPGPVVSEAGAPNGGGAGGQPGSNASGGVATSIGGNVFDSAGTGGSNVFGTGTAGAGEPFGIGGSGPGSGPFGIAGTPSPFSGASSF
ncbi:MAG TPA: hypothetical protein VER12_07820 [Polyangiaceae bacterium]|nr:hypothetical protein [Polyangiaceae bacterium]